MFPMFGQLKQDLDIVHMIAVVSLWSIMFDDIW